MARISHALLATMKLSQKRSIAWIAALAIAGAAGCASVPETAWTVPEVDGAEEEVVCSGACEEEWGRAEEWVKKYSGYPFPAEVTVKPDRIEASRIPIRNCESVPQTRRQSLCPDLPLASEPLGIEIDDPPGSMLGKTFADGGPHWTFLVVRQTPKSGWSSIRLIQACHARRGSRACGAPGILRHRQDRFRRFVRTGEHLSE